MAATETSKLPQWHVPPKPESKKRKKNPPDKPQPAWLFPPDEENLVLNPKPKTEEQQVQEKEDRDKAIDYMKRRIHNVPDRPAPPHRLLTLIGAFLTEYGFNSTSRLFTNERKNRQVLAGWEDNIGAKLPADMPSLEAIFKEWQKRHQSQMADETSSDSDSESYSDNASDASSSASSSDSDSDSDSGSDVKMEDAHEDKKASKIGGKSKRGPESSSATSDSDADDEDDKVVISKTKVKREVPPSTVTGMINRLKRKAESSSSESSSSSDSDSAAAKPQIKKAKTGISSQTNEKIVSDAATNIRGKITKKSESPTVEAAAKPLPSSSSDDSDDSDSDSSMIQGAKIKDNAKHVSQKGGNAKILKNKVSTKSDSSSASSSSDSDSSDSDDAAKEALPKNSGSTAPSAPARMMSASSSSTVASDGKQGHVPDESSSSDSDSSSSDSDAASKPTVPVKGSSKKSHKGAEPTPLAALSAQDHSHLPSNSYVNYDYADRAYQDLSVTRGKGFTKEKNKKKRGSYRGGNIDIGPGKGFKFDD